MKLKTLIMLPLIALAGCATSPDFTSIDHGLRPVGIFEQPSFAGASDAVVLPNLASQLNPLILDRLPKNPVEADKLYDQAEWLKPFNFSGVSRVVNGDRRTATLISDRFVVMALHYHRPVGDVLTWKAKDGAIVTRKLVKLAHSGLTDLTLGLLDSPVGNNLAIYRVLPGDRDWHSILTRVLSIHTDQEHKAHLKMIVQAGTIADDRQAFATYFDANWERPIVSPVMVEKLVSGDSGNPFFLLWGNELVLLGTHWTTSSGPNLSDPDTIEWIQSQASSMLVSG